MIPFAKTNRKITTIVLHCTASPEGVNQTTEAIKKFHTSPKRKDKNGKWLGRGWSDIGYHFVIELDGSIHVGRSLDKQGTTQKVGKNCIDVVYVGGSEATETVITTKSGKKKKVLYAKDTRTAAQKKSLRDLVSKLTKDYPNARVAGHYEFAQKACPSFDVAAEFPNLGATHPGAWWKYSFKNSSYTPPETSDEKPKRQPSTTSSQHKDEEVVVNNVSIKRLRRGWVGGKTELKISSPFGKRKAKKKGMSTNHKGIDISIPVGTPIYSPVEGNGEVRFQGVGKGGGLYVSIISNGHQYYFMHLSKAFGSTGSKKSFKIGDLIGYSGGDPKDRNVGRSTGPHLHFQCNLTPNNNNTAINPIRILSDKLISKTNSTLSSGFPNMPLVTDNVADDEYFVDEDTEITEENIDSDNEQDVTDLTDFSQTEDEDFTEVETQDGYARGIWQIVKLLQDTDVANLQLYDVATSVQAGPLVTFFNKVCQKPFVEFSGDTFGDQYCFVVRRPPFDRETMLKTLVAQGLFSVETKEEKERVSKQNSNENPYIIYEDDLLSSNLSFNTQGIYSWYQFYPMYEMGDASDLQYIIPAVLFPEYASIWGSRELSIRSQYRSFNNAEIQDRANSGEASPIGDAEVRMSIDDLKFIIESNAYAPFVRQGTITILGNRKIKRGTFIKISRSYLNADEIFFVENVSHNYSINSGSPTRTTTLTLSHGMMEDYMFGGEDMSFITDINDPSKDIEISYFKLINFGDYEKYKGEMNMDKWREIISSWKVNTPVFLFFLRRMQFLNNMNKEVVVTQ